MNKDRYTIGWSDYRAQYGTPKVEWEPIHPKYSYNAREYLAYVGMATGVSMMVAPMAWVQLIAWVLA
jgi:hypothetical protein